MKKNKIIKICLISSSGGHFEQLKNLFILKNKYDIYVVTERTAYKENCDYVLFSGNSNKFLSFLSLFLNFFKSFFLFLKERPNVIITTGTMVAFPTILIGKLFRRKIIYIETFARIEGGTKAGHFVYKHHLYDTFIYQWEAQSEYYPKGAFGGSIYDIR